MATEAGPLDMAGAPPGRGVRGALPTALNVPHGYMCPRLGTLAIAE